MQMVKIAWDLEDWEFMAVDPTVLELFPCSRQDTVSWAQVTLLSVNPTICSQEGNIAHPLLPLCPTWDQKNLPLPQTVPAHSQESVAPPARSLEWRLPGKTASEFHFGNMESQHLFLNTPPKFLCLLQSQLGSRAKSMDMPGQAGSCATHRKRETGQWGEHLCR